MTAPKPVPEMSDATFRELADAEARGYKRGLEEREPPKCMTDSKETWDWQRGYDAGHQRGLLGAAEIAETVAVEYDVEAGWAVVHAIRARAEEER